MSEGRSAVAAAPRSSGAAPLRLALFDMDGTLIDSLAQIEAAMAAGFAAVDRPPPPSDAVRMIIGLDVPAAFERVAKALGQPLGDGEIARAAAAFRAAFQAARAAGRGEGASPLYPGAQAALERLAATDLLLGIATGKARRGLDHALEAHGLRRFFVTTQTASEAPGKPHPAMIERALDATGVAAAAAVMIGDSTYDMEMARNAGAAALGVAWGYHDAEALRAAGASAVISDFAALDAALDELWGASWRRVD